jgi:hypothetical protein
MERILAVAAEYCTGAECQTANVDVSEGAVAGLVAALGGLIFLVVIIGIAFFVFWVVMLVDAATRDEKSFKEVGAGEKTIWLLVLVLSMFLGLSWLAAILYYFIVRKKAKSLEAPKDSKKN